MVTGGGLTPQNTWAGPKQARWLFPLHAVGHVFRAKFCAGLLQLQAAGQLQFHGQLQPLAEPAAFAALLHQLRSRRWVVFAKGSVVGPDHVLDYLGRYTHRVAISNSRLRALDRQTRTLSFTYKDYADASRLKTLTLSGAEFIRRFLFHVLPQGFTKIRHYGLLGNNRRTQQVARARLALEQSPLRFAPKAPPPSAAPARPSLACPHCQATSLRCVARLDASGQWTFFAAVRGPDLPRYLDTS
ncbi:MAG TPA: transposase [bacterium]|nr:transposase [bacterium]